MFALIFLVPPLNHNLAQTHGAVAQPSMDLRRWEGVVRRREEMSRE